MDVVQAASAGLALLVGAHLVYNLFLKLRGIPGPPLAKLTNIWRLLDNYSGKSEHTQTALHRKYGSAVRIGPNVVSLSDPDLIRVVYSTKDRWIKSKQVENNDFYVGKEKFHTTLSVRDEALHTTMTKPVTKLYSIANVLTFEPLVDSTQDSFFEQLEKRFVATGEACPIDKWVHYLAWDAMAEMTFSKRLGFLAEGRDVDDMIDIGNSSAVYLSAVGQMPILDKVFNKGALWGARGFETLAGFSFARLMERKAGADKTAERRTDYLDEFLKIQSENPGTPDIAVVGWMQSNVLAGSDTTAITLRAVIYYLAKHLDAQKKLQQELDEAHVGERPAYRAVRELSYLEAVFHEATRLHPGVAIVLERLVPSGGLDLGDGRKLPAGTIVGMNPYVVHRNAEVFGEDVDEFRPERWLQARDESAEAFKERQRRMQAADLTFGFGKRGCSGKNVALVQMYKLVARVYSAYDVVLVDPKTEWKTSSTWFYFNWDIDVYLRPRAGR